MQGSRGTDWEKAVPGCVEFRWNEEEHFGIIRSTIGARNNSQQVMKGMGSDNGFGIWNAGYHDLRRCFDSIFVIKDHTKHVEKTREKDFSRDFADSCRLLYGGCPFSDCPHLEEPAMEFFSLDEKYLQISEIYAILLLSKGNTRKERCTMKNQNKVIEKQKNDGVFRP